MSSKGTTAQNRYGIGTSNCTCGAFGIRPQQEAPTVCTSHIAAMKRAAGSPVPPLKLSWIS